MEWVCDLSHQHFSRMDWDPIDELLAFASAPILFHFHLQVYFQKFNIAFKISKTKQKTMNIP